MSFSYFSQFRNLAFAVGFCVTSFQAIAAIQCASGPGTYGSVTVAVPIGKSCRPNNTFAGASFALVSLGSCSFTFSPAVSATGLYAVALGLQSDETLSFSVNGTAYPINSAEVDLTSTPPASPGLVAASGGNLIYTGSGASGVLGSGRVNFLAAPSAGVTNVTISHTATARDASGVTVCFEDTPVPLTYTVGGSVTGLASGQSVALLNNAGNSTTVNSNTSFTFSTAINSGGAYAVTVGTQPTGQTCTVTNGSGNVSANVTNVSVSCTDNTVQPIPTPNPVQPIPTLGEWAMIFMASLMAMFGIRRMRRTK
jgi:hypothetical protein